MSEKTPLNFSIGTETDSTGEFRLSTEDISPVKGNVYFAKDADSNKSQGRIYYDDETGKRYVVTSFSAIYDDKSHNISSYYVTKPILTTNYSEGKYYFTFTNGDGSASDYHLTDIYIDGWTWENGVTTGPKAKIKRKKNGVAYDTIQVAAIPHATTTRSGVVTAADQTFKGIKTFQTQVKCGTGDADETVLDVQGNANINYGLGFQSNAAKFLYDSTGKTLTLSFQEDDGKFIVEDDTNINENLTVVGNTTLGSQSTNTVTISGPATLNSTLTVSDATSLGSTLSVSGDASLAAKLEVDGATSLNNTLTVAEATTLSKTLGVSGNTTVGGTLTVTGATSLSSLSTSGNVSIGGNETVTGNLTVNGNTILGNSATNDSVTIKCPTAIQSTLNVTGATTLSTLSASGNTTIGGTLTVTGATSLSSLSTSGNTTIGGTLGVTSAATLNNSLTVKGSTSLQSTLGVTGATTLNSTLLVKGSTTLGDASDDTVTIKGPAAAQSTLAVVGATTLNSTLLVKGSTTLGDASDDTVTIKGPATLSSTLNVGGATTLNSTLLVKGKTILGDASDDTVTIKGPTTLNSTLSVAGNTTLSGTLSVAGATTLGSNLTITGNIVPSASITYNLGSASYPWLNIYASNIKATLSDGTEGASLYTNASTTLTSATGSYLVLGNSTNSGTVKNRYGVLRIYGQKSGYTDISADTTTTSGYTLYLPAASGQIVYHTNDTQIGGSSAPVYVASSGQITACSQPVSGSWFQGVPCVTSGGVMEIGRYIDFHSTSAATSDYSIRIDAGEGNAQNILYLPDISGQVVVHSNNTQIGSGINPVYVSTSGNITASSSTIGSTTAPVYLNGGTITSGSTYAGGTRVTLNNASCASSTASFYAPTGAGTSGYILKSNGSGAPSWSAVTNKAATLSYNSTSTIATIAGTNITVTMPLNYYHSRVYSSGLQISTGTNLSNMYVPNASSSQAGVVSTGSQTFAGAKTFSGKLTANGGIVVDADTYGPSLPSSGTTGQIFFKLI